ncbi:hypothetical protein F4X88_00575 [Candidatus Poribacteria bacterium]|nr:hypothetical protein [Candidatus Poribacteria bacterium]MYA54763.1 hypothetical protein [Candidatus Poribacteria bacterium]
MDAVIIDTNVMVVANGKAAAPQARCKCIIRCRARLAEILRESERVLLDDKKRIIQEYRRNLNKKGRGFGDRFWQELVRRMWNSEKVIRVPITPLAGNGTDFEEFPNDDASLKGFHKKDRKFVAVALAYQSDTGQEAPILKAEDSGWEEFREALAAYGVRVDSICEEDS